MPALSRNTIEQRMDWECSICEDHSTHKLVHSDVEDYTTKYSGNAINLHIGDTFSPDHSGLGVIRDLIPSNSEQVRQTTNWISSAGYQGTGNSPEKDRSTGLLREGVVRVPPGEFVFFLTEEVIRLPVDVCGQLFMQPMIANRGLLFFTAGHIAPGWAGKLTGTMVNMTNDTVYLNRSDYILYLQLIETDIDDQLGEKSKAHPSHADPQVTVDQARRGELAHPKPGFALTTQFVTKRDLYEVTIITLTLLTVVLAILTGNFPGLSS